MWPRAQCLWISLWKECLCMAFAHFSWVVCPFVVGCKGYTLNTKSSSHVLINVFSHVLHSLLSILYSQDFILSESWFHSLQLNKIPLCVCTTSVTHSSVTEQQGWLHISVFMNGTAIAMILQSLCGVLAGSPLSTHWEVLQWEQLVRQIAHVWHRMWI